MNAVEFFVTDTHTEKYPDLESIARTEEWANGLVYCDMDGFAINEDGMLILQDECGNYRYCPHDRFSIRIIIEADRTISYSFIY